MIFKIWSVDSKRHKNNDVKMVVKLQISNHKKYKYTNIFKNIRYIHILGLLCLRAIMPYG